MITSEGGVGVAVELPGVAVCTGVLVLVAVGGTDVAGDVDVAVGGTDVAGDVDVAVGGTEVAGDVDVAVGGTEVAVGGTDVAVGVDDGTGSISLPKLPTAMAQSEA